jgi:hypothetical protein
VSESVVSVATSPVTDGRGFVGVVMVGDHGAYRTLRAYPTTADGGRCPGAPEAAPVGAIDEATAQLSSDR